MQTVPETGHQHWQEAMLLPKFYERVGMQVGGLIRDFQASSFDFGYGFVDETFSPPKILKVPYDISAIPEVFYTGRIEPEDVTYNEGRLLIKCMMPHRSVTEPKRFSMTGIKDNEDNLLAVSVDLPDWITPDETIHAHPYINFIPKEVTF